MNKLLLTSLVLALTGCSLFASKVEANAEISGSVESRCTVNTDTPGVYGNPNAYTLTTAPASAGQKPIVRFDVSLANAYHAQVSYPEEFSSSPSLSDTVAWTGSVGVAQSSSSDFDDYQSNSTTTGAMRQYSMADAGTLWVEVESQATYGGGQQKAFPGGSYTAIVVAECVAQ